MNATKTTDTVCVAGYVNGSYEQVCELLAGWSGRPLSYGVESPPDFVIGDLLQASRWISRLPLVCVRGDVDEGVVELRVLPVTTGHDSVTELLLVTEEPAGLSHVLRVRSAHLLLDAVVQQLDAALSADSPIHRLAS